MFCYQSLLSIHLLCIYSWRVLLSTCHVKIIIRDTGNNSSEKQISCPQWVSGFVEENKINLYTHRLLNISDTDECYEGHQMRLWVRV